MQIRRDSAFTYAVFGRRGITVAHNPILRRKNVENQIRMSINIKRIVKWGARSPQTWYVKTVIRGSTTRFTVVCVKYP
jgi:hypothetical protein